MARSTEDIKKEMLRLLPACGLSPAPGGTIGQILEIVAQQIRSVELQVDELLYEVMHPRRIVRGILQLPEEEIKLIAEDVEKFTPGEKRSGIRKRLNALWRFED
jgi:hypothetical protein